MKTITFEDIKALNIDAQTYYDWIDFPLRNRDKFTLPTKVKIPMVGDDYCNIMPCAFPDGNVLGLKVINRNENRRNDGRINLDSQILLYSYETCDLLCVMDGNYITTNAYCSCGRSYDYKHGGGLFNYSHGRTWKYWNSHWRYAFSAYKRQRVYSEVNAI